MHTKKELDQRLLRAGVSPLKKLGQNFLVNPVICQRLIDEVKRSAFKAVVEIGPGLGALTDDLVAMSKTANFNFTMIELDQGFVRYWEERKTQENLNFKIFHGDALQLDWDNLGIMAPACLVSNLPYSIAASIVMEVSQHTSKLVKKMILMFQKEVAERIQASVHGEDYGMLSVVAQSFWEIEKLIDAGPQDFFPVPNVGSRVLNFENKSVDVDPVKFVKFVKLAFSQRRKKLSSNLSAGFNKNILQAVFEKHKLSPDVRAQELSPRQFQEIFQALI